jgi:WD40 repeat protein
LQYKKNSFAVFNGLTLAKIGSFNISDDESDYAYSFSFAPDNSLLIVGTYQGTLLCYKINDNVIDPVPGTIKQNTNSEYIGAISVSSTLQIAAGGSGIALSLYTINDDKSFKLVH